MSILLISPKDVYITKRIIDEAAKAKIVIDVFGIQELADRHFEVAVNRYDALYIRFCYPYFPQTVELAKQFINAGKTVVDAGIATGDVGLGKMPVYEQLAEAGISVPRTQWFLQAQNWQYPCILKWAYGFGGKDVFLVNNPEALRKSADIIPAEELIMQEFILAEYEYKVITVGYKSLPVVLRFNIDKHTHRPDFDSAVVVHVPAGDAACRAVVDLAQRSAALLKRELAKTDILQKGNEFYVLEVNRWPGLKSFEELTGYNAVKEFLEYITKKSLQKLPN